NLFDGKKYPTAELPLEMSAEAKQNRGRVDPRLNPMTLVMGVETANQTKAFPIETNAERACYMDVIAGDPVAVFWYKPTRSAIAWSGRLEERTLHFYADSISPETAPFKDKETGTRWTLAGRAVDGPLKGKELTWVNGVQCRWYAWSAEYPQTQLYHKES